MAFAADKIRQGAAGTGGDFTLDQSLRFNDNDSAYLSRTPSSASNRRTWTFSAWVKNSSMSTADSGNASSIFEAYEDDSNRVRLYFDDGDNPLSLYCKISNTITMRLLTNAVYRDFSAWYHIVLAVDTTQGTDTNRVKLYVNGEQITSFSSSTYPSQNVEHAVNNTNVHHVGAGSYSGSIYAGTHFDGYMSEVHFIDGTALTPASFGEAGDYGDWKPIKVSGLTYGTNGFYLSFAGGGILAATGGTITTDGDYKVHSFTADGTFTPTSVPSSENYVEYLVVAGGGAGTNGGGGGGGFRTGVLTVSAQAYSITVGDGGVLIGQSGQPGEDSVFSSITSVGGGKPGNTGGSGGGGEGGGSGGAGTAGQGYAGGLGGSASTGFGAGGGGASEVGTAGASGGTGGDGLQSYITGTGVYYAGGGGGGAASGVRASAAGGLGGGGTGKDYSDSSSNATANTGGGGGGNYNGGGYRLGGSGIVIIRYKFQ